MGFPLLADIQAGVFYPPHLFFYVLSFFDAVRVIFVLHYLIAISGAYLLCRHWGYPRYHSMIGAVLFTFGGTTVSLINLLNHFQSAVWLPWTMLLWERFLRHAYLGQLRHLCFGASVPTPRRLAGDLHDERRFACGCKDYESKIGAARRNLVRPTFWLFVANLVVILLTMMQLLPTLELIHASRREESIPFVEAASWSLNPWTLLNLFFLDKKVDMSLGDATQMFFGLDIPFFVSYYFGAIFIPGAWLVGVLHQARKKDLFSPCLLQPL